MVERRVPNQDKKVSLPDDILVSIFSFLTYKEAVATSILSHRCRYLWTSISSLNFDGTELLLNPSELVEEKSWDFVRFVDRAISLRENPIVEVFRILFYLNNIHSKSIDRWLEYAFESRKLQRLELNLVNEELMEGESCKWGDNFYTFPYKFYCSSIHYKCLKSIIMNKVNLNNEAIDFFLHNCPLEELSVSASMDLLSLKIVEPPPSFKYLELSLCCKLNSVEIRDANLVHLKYVGELDINFVIENVPLLTSFYVGRPTTYYLERVFPSILPQLETFEIHDADIFNSEDTQLWYGAVKMIRLKQLVVGFTDSCRYFLPHVTKLMDASPSLERLILVRFHGEIGRCKRRHETHKMNNRHFALKRVEFKGYHGCSYQQKMVRQLLHNAANLDSLVIDTSEPAYAVSQRCKANYIRPSHAIYEKNARTRATKQLKNLVPPGIKTIIVDPNLKTDARVPVTDDSSENDMQSSH